VSDATLEIQALLRSLIEQQTALLSVHAEAVRLQGVLVARLLGATPAQAESVEPTRLAASANSPATGEASAAPLPTVQVGTTDEKLSDIRQPAGAVATGVESQQILDPTPAGTPGDGPLSRVVGATAARSDRYYQSRQPSEPAQARRISPERLDVLRRIQAAGDIAHLIVTFGPHAGETLGQVARSDPDYLCQLATTAQRPDGCAVCSGQASGCPASHRVGSWKSLYKKLTSR